MVESVKKVKWEAKTFNVVLVFLALQVSAEREMFRFKSKENKSSSSRVSVIEPCIFFLFIFYFLPTTQVFRFDE